MVHRGMWRYRGRYGTVTFLPSLAAAPSPPDPRPRPDNRLVISGCVGDYPPRYVGVFWVGAL